MVEDQVIAEPYSRNTAPALGLAALHIRAKAGPTAVMASFHADHVIADLERFKSAVAAAIEAAREPNVLVTIGIRPSCPHTGYGYIEVQGAVDVRSSEEPGVLRVERFVEKPDLERAKRFIKEGSYLWNSGMFFWRVDTLIKAVDRYLPRLYRDLMIIDKEIGTSNEFETTRAIFAELEAVAIDRGVMERADSVLTVPGDFGWNDVGSFATLYDYWEPDEHGNRIRGRAVALKSTGLLVDSPRKLVAAVGVDDLIIVDTSSAILICSKRSAQDVGKIVDMLQERGEIEHL
jgi:mannose-1-phosphate guanylyltransferase